MCTQGSGREWEDVGAALEADVEEDSRQTEGGWGWARRDPTGDGAGRVEARAHVRGMLDHPRYLLRGERAPGDDELTLVLVALIIHDDEKLAAHKHGNGIFDGVERERDAGWQIGHLLRPCGGGRGGNEGEVGRGGNAVGQA